MKQLLLLLFIIIPILISCNSKNGNDTIEQLHIAAASNLVQVFTEIGAQFEEEHSIELVFSFGSSGQLADQIVNGAPYDLFTPASNDFLDKLNDEELLINKNYTTYAFGTIGLATLKESEVQVENFNDFLKEDVVKIAIANPEHAPYGLAAKQALQEAGIWEEIEAKLVFGRNISDTLALLQTKNVEAAIIALSLKDDEKVTYTAIGEHLYAPLNHAIAIMEGTERAKAAQTFIDFLFSEKGQQILMKYGYAIP